MREATVRLLLDYCIPSKYQTEAKTTTQNPFDEIDKKILSSNLTICLIGDRFGTKLPDKVPDGFSNNNSWTQYEYLKAGLEKRPRWVLFYEPTKSSRRKSSVDEAQKAFIQTVHADQKRGAHEDCFSDTFTSLASLKRILVNYIEGGTDPWLEPFRRERWEKAKAQFRRISREKWLEEYPQVYAGVELPKNLGHPPFIENQRLDLLDKKANKIYLPHLRPAAFVNSRQTEAEEEADKHNHWKPKSYDAILKMLIPPKGKRGWERRVFFVSGGGVGKTEALKRLVFKINDSTNPSTPDQPSNIAFNLKASDLFEGQSEPDVLDILARKLCDSNEQPGGVFHESQTEQWARKKSTGECEIRQHRINEMKRYLSADLSNGTISLFIDGLDHLGKNRFPRFFGSIQESGGLWENCPIVMSGRPYIIQSHFKDEHNDSHRQLLASRWRFVRPGEFDSQQQAAYLGIDKTDYDKIPREALSILSVPRTIKYARGWAGGPGSLAKIKTSVEVYCHAIDRILGDSMKGALDAQAIQAGSKRQIGNDTVSSDQKIKFMRIILSAAAMAMTEDGAKKFNPNFDRIRVADSFVLQVFRRFKRCGEIGYAKWTDEDFRKVFVERLAALNTVVNNGITEGPVDQTLQELLWDNKSIQCFFAAYWLANFAYTSGAKDCELFRSCMIWYPELEIDDYYELNQFLAEMPDPHRDAMNWLSSIKGWFAPPKKNEEERGFRRSSEMMYRAWPSLIGLSKSKDRDWWNAPYEALYSGTKWYVSKNPRENRDEQAQQLAFGVLIEFRGELDRILNGPRRDRRTIVANEFISDGNWKSVTGGSFKMGSPPGTQGFPKKTERFWIRKLLSVIQGANTRSVAEACNRQEWFRGAQGSRLRKKDVKWLQNIFDNLKRDAGSESVDDPAFKTAKTEILNHWRRKDESPVERDQQVSSFKMNQYPVLNEWFALFASGHHNSVKTYLRNNNAAKRDSVESESHIVKGFFSQDHSNVRRNWNPEQGDHPVIFVSWFDAWAFCQWATWTQPDPNNQKKSVRYRCRLPHEPEWEFAARQGIDKSGRGRAIPFKQRYWWGDTFYEHEQCDETCETCDVREPISNEFAHADGRPGRTRSPTNASPNGFGFRDILGNVWEWNANMYFDRGHQAGKSQWSYSRHLPTSNSTVPINADRAMRGGLWYFLDVMARCSSRYRSSSDDRD